MLTSGGQSCTLWILEFISTARLRCCVTYTSVKVHKSWSIQGYRSRLGYGYRNQRIVPFFVFQPSNWVLHAHTHRCILYNMTCHIYVYRYNMLYLKQISGFPSIPSIPNSWISMMKLIHLKRYPYILMTNQWDGRNRKQSDWGDVYSVQ